MSIFKEVDLVVFDLDGTFYPQKKVKASLIKKLVFHLRKLSKYQKARHSIIGSEFNSFEELLSETSKRMGLANNNWILNKFYPTFLDSFNSLEKHPDIDFVLKELKGQSKKIAVVSDYGYVEKRLNLLGINPNQFDFLLGTESEGLLKPNVKIAEIISESLNVPLDKTLFIGDRVDTDQELAKKANSKFLGVHFETPKSPDFYTWEQIKVML